MQLEGDALFDAYWTHFHNGINSKANKYNNWLDGVQI